MRRPGYWAEHRRKLRKAKIVDSDSIFESKSMTRAREVGGARLFKQMAEFGYDPEPSCVEGAGRKKSAGLIPANRVPVAPEYQPNIALNEKRSEQAATSSQYTAKTTESKIPFPFLRDMMSNVSNSGKLCFFPPKS